MSAIHFPGASRGSGVTLADHPRSIISEATFPFLECGGSTPLSTTKLDSSHLPTFC